MASTPSKQKTAVAGTEQIVLAANEEWDRLKAKIEKKIADRKKLPLKKSDVKTHVRNIAREVLK